MLAEVGIQIAGLFVSVAITSYPTILFIIPTIIIFFYYGRNFKKTMPHIKRLEAIARSPVTCIAQETLDNLIFLRANNKTDIFMDQYRQSTDVTTTLFFAWFGSVKFVEYRTGVTTCIMIPLVILANMLISPASMAIAKYSGVVLMNITTVSQILLTVLFYLISLDGDMASVERVIEYTQID